MPMIENGGYHAPNTQEAIVAALRQLQQPGTESIHLLQPSFTLMWRQTNRPGVFFHREDGSPGGLLEAVNQVGGTFTFAAFLLDGEPSGKAIRFIPPSERVKLITLGQILREVKNPLEARRLFVAHTDRDTVWTTLGLHVTAMNRSLRRIGIENPAQYVEDLIDDATLSLANRADKVGGDWLNKMRENSNVAGQTVITDLDEIWAARTVEADGTPIHGDMWNIHTPVISVKELIGLPPRFRNAQKTLFDARIQNTDLIVVHTRADARRLESVADYLDIDKKSRAETYVRNLMPPSFVDIEPIDVRPENAADFLKEAVAKGRIIAGTAQRLDPIKMDPIVFDGFESFIHELRQLEYGIEILKNFRISFVTEVGSFEEDQRIKVLFDRYTGHVYRRIDEINALFRQVMQENGGPADEDFILTYRDTKGHITGYTHKRLIHEVYPFYNIAFQLGQEGLCQSVIEPLLVGSFGLTVPRPPVLVISRGIGFSEKAGDFQLPNVHIIESPWDGREFTQAFVAAYNMAVGIRNNPDSPLIEEIRRKTAAYGDTAGDAFYAEALNALYEAKQRKSTRHE